MCIGTDARYSAPEEGASWCLLRLLLRIAVGDCSRLPPSRVAVLGREAGSLSITASFSLRLFLFLELLRPKKGTLMLLLLLPDGVFTRSRSRSPCRRLRLEVFGLSDPLTIEVDVWGVKEPVFSGSALASEAVVERRELGIDGRREIVLEMDREGVAADARWERFFSFSFSRTRSSSLASSGVLCCFSLLREVQRWALTMGWSVLNTPERRRSCLELILQHAYYGELHT